MQQRIRPAAQRDLSRIAEILVFNNRLHFFPIFGDEAYSFGEMQVLPLAEQYRTQPGLLQRTFVYDDGLVRGFAQLNGPELERLYVDPFFQSRGIGQALLHFAVQQGAWYLWALEKNHRAVKFYRTNGFVPTGERKLEEGTSEYLIKLAAEHKNASL